MLDFLNFADMHIVLILVLFALGILFIVKGGDWFVDAASWIAEAAGIPKFIVGATIVSLATTLPELITSVIATATGSTELAIGNAVGSVTANIGLIMAISVFFLPSPYGRKEFAPKAILMAGAAVLLLALSITGELKASFAWLLFLVLGAFIYENVVSAKKSMTSAEDRPKISGREIAFNLGKFAVGTVGIVLGSNLLVETAKVMASRAGVSEAIIGATIVAIGTSLPELVTTITALVKKQSSLSVGNIIGANIIDLTLILPVCSMVHGGALPVAPSNLPLDFPACIAVCLIAVIPTLITQKFKKWQGVAMFAVYIAYVLILSFVQF